MTATRRTYREGYGDGIGYEQHVRQVPALEDLENACADAECDPKSNAGAGVTRAAARGRVMVACLYMTTDFGKLPLVTFSTLMPRAFNAGSASGSETKPDRRSTYSSHQPQNHTP